MHQVEASEREITPLCLGHRITVFDAYEGVPQSDILIGSTYRQGLMPTGHRQQMLTTEKTGMQSRTTGIKGS